jgi:uncharacterized membrane protein
MSKKFTAELDELVCANVITSETADDIRRHYNSAHQDNPNKLLLIFSIFGAVLSGLGIILILAHNWDDLPQLTKACISFIPLLIGQLFCGFALLKKPENDGWRESASAFLFFGIGASMALVAQVYNIPGNLESFVLTWMVLALPQVYLMRSSITSLLYIAGISYYGSAMISFLGDAHYEYWLLLAAILPYYYKLLTTKPRNNFTFFHNWFLCLSAIICLLKFVDSGHDLAYVAYMSLFAIYYFIGSLPFFDHQKTRNNSFFLIGQAGTLLVLLMLTFEGHLHWNDTQRNGSPMLSSPVFAIAVLLTLIALVLFFIKNRTRYQHIRVIDFVFLWTAFLFIAGGSGQVISNILVLLMGLSEMRRGNQQNNLGILNYGLIIITILVICRFFDTEFSFVVRGILFIMVGLGFFMANYLMLKKRKSNGQ